MSKAVVKQTEMPDWTPEQMRLITDVVARGATKDELQLFLYRCKNMGLDPLKPGQIYFVKYGNSPGTIVVGIEGFRARAHKTGKISGVKRGAIRDESGKLVGAWAEVYRSDWKEPAREEVPLAEYTTGKAGWVKMPETMIKKVAEAAALRMAFPDDLGGIYTDAEMSQAEVERPRGVYPEQPGAEDGTPPTEPEEFKFRKGTYAQRGPAEAERVWGLEHMRKWVLAVEGRIEKAKKDNTVLQDQAIWQEDIDACARYIANRENAPTEAFEEWKGEEVK